MALSGIPISINECIGDSLHTINAAFTALDFRTASISPPTTAGNVFITTISGANIIIGGPNTTTTISGNLLINQDLYLSGNAFLSGDLIVDGVITSPLLSSTGDLVVDGNGFVAGTFTACTLSATCDIITNGDLEVFGDAYIHGKLTAAELSSTGPLTVDGDTTLKGNLSVWGNSFLGDQCSDFTQIQGTLKLPCINSQNAIEFNGETTINGTPLKDGVVLRYDTNLFGLNDDGLLIEKTDWNQNFPSGGIAVRNRGSGGSFSTKDDFAIRGDGKVGIRTWYPNKELTVIGEISATDHVRFDKNFHVGGNTILGDGGKLTTIKDDLDIMGDAYLAGDLIIDGDLTVLGQMTQLDTEVQITSAVEIINHGTTAALTINQTGNTPVVNFFDDGSSVFYINGNTSNAGYVGLAQVNPSERLEVNGNLAFSRNPGGSGFREIKIVTTPANSTDLKINATNNTIIQETAGRVAIRRNNPATELDVNGDVTITDKIIHSGDTNTCIRFPANDNFAIETNGIDRVRVIGDGKVGINQPAPTAQLHVGGDVIISDNMTFNNPVDDSRRVINIRPVSRNEILLPGIYDNDALPVKSFRDFMFDDGAFLIIPNSYTVLDDDHNRTYVCTNTAPITITCPAGRRIGLQVSFIRAGSGEVTFTNGPGASVNSALNFKKLAFVNSAGTVYLGQTNTYYLFGDLLP